MQLPATAPKLLVSETYCVSVLASSRPPLRETGMMVGLSGRLSALREQRSKKLTVMLTSLTAKKNQKKTQIERVHREPCSGRLRWTDRIDGQVEWQFALLRPEHMRPEGEYHH